MECFGYVYTTPLLNRKLNKDKIIALFNEKGGEWKEIGITESDVFKRLYSNNEVVFPDGTRIDPADPAMFTFSSEVKKVAILGDTRDASEMKQLLEGCDVMVHEATIAGLKREHVQEDRVKASGHSTIRMAGEFARSCNARRLLLTHFSSRYSSQDEKEMMQLAVTAFGSSNVSLASDFFTDVILCPVCSKHVNRNACRG